MTNLMLDNIIVNENILEDEKYKLLFTVESVNQLVNEGMPFRDAYIKIGKDVENGNYQKPPTILHTHEGSIGNLGNESIKANFEKILSQFNFIKMAEAYKKLLS